MIKTIITIIQQEAKRLDRIINQIKDSIHI